jgi:secreted trypsin-like serine protease
MRRLVAALAVTAASLVIGLVPASAITNGQPDGNGHPYVGLVVFDVLINGQHQPSHRCSVSLLTPTVALTAAHCTIGTSRARIWFAENVQANTEYPFSGTTSFDGTGFTNPAFCNPCGNGVGSFAQGDVGIILLSEPVPISVVNRYAALPTQGVVDTLKNKTSVDLVGYGVQFQAQIPGSALPGPPPPPPFLRWTGPRVRLFAPSELVTGNFQHSDEVIRIALNTGGGSGGVCFGDSGGPDFLSGTNIVLGVNSFGNFNCTGHGFSSRVDTESALEFINEFL